MSCSVYLIDSQFGTDLATCVVPVPVLKAYNILLHVRSIMFSIFSDINQGNTALKRVIESIANGDSHVPFRNNKLTMLLQVHHSKNLHLLIQPLLLSNTNLNISFIVF